MISVGIITGGPECKFMDSHIRQLMRFIKHTRVSEVGKSEVNIVFHMPGSVVKPGFFGPHVEKVYPKEKTVTIEIGVEKEFVQSTSDKVVVQYIYEVTDEAIGIAKGEFERQSIPYDLEQDRQILDRWYYGGDDQ